MVYQSQPGAFVCIIPTQHSVSTQSVPPKYFQFVFTNPGEFYHDLLLGLRHINPSIQIDYITWYDSNTGKQFQIGNEMAMQYAIAASMPTYLFVYTKQPFSSTYVDTGQGVSMQNPLFVNAQHNPDSLHHIHSPSLGFTPITSTITSQQPHLIQGFLPQQHGVNTYSPGVLSSFPPMLTPRSQHVSGNVTNDDVVDGRRHTEQSDLRGDLHVGYKCDGCQGAIYGIRYRCSTCTDYDLCEACKKQGHHGHHSFIAITQPVKSNYGNQSRTTNAQSLVYTSESHDSKNMTDSSKSWVAPKPITDYPTIEKFWTSPHLSEDAKNLESERMRKSKNNNGRSTHMPISPVSDAQRKGGWSALSKDN